MNHHIIVPPKADYHFQFPFARRISEEMRPYPALMNLKNSYLVGKLMKKYRCGKNTAYQAIRFFREGIEQC